MKNIIALFAFLLVGGAYASSPSLWYNGTYPGYPNSTVRSADAPPFSYHVADVKLIPGDTAYSQVYDTYKVPLLVLDSLGQKAVFDTLLGFGSVVVSCYDISDSAALVDSVIVTTTLQASLYAADGVNPNLSNSAAWDSVGVVTLAKPSDANAQVTGTLRPSLVKREHRFFRWRLANLSATSGAPLKNVSRCRVDWMRRQMSR
jgi:hypothetical protein